MKIAIIGRTQALYDSARRLNEAGHQIECIITARAAPEYTRSEQDFESLAADLGVPFLLAESSTAAQFSELCQGVDIGISVNWVSIVGQKQIDLFRVGILNAHMGDLPKYRGNAVANWAILLGESEIVNSIHLMEGGELDCGRVIEQARFDLSDEKDIGDVMGWFAETTPLLFVSAVAKLSDDANYNLKYADPYSAESFRCYPRLPQDGLIDWSRSAREIHNLVRAVAPPFAGAFSYLSGSAAPQKISILKTRVVSLDQRVVAVPGQILKNERQSGESWICCGQGVVAVKLCKFDDGKPFRPGTCWRSIRLRLQSTPTGW